MLFWVPAQGLFGLYSSPRLVPVASRLGEKVVLDSLLSLSFAILFSVEEFFLKRYWIVYFILLTLFHTHPLLPLALVLLTPAHRILFVSH